MTPPDWLAQGVSMLRPAARSTGPRSTQERLKATLRLDEEAMSPRMLRQTLKDLQAIVDPMVSEVEGGRRAQAMMDWYATASMPHRRDLWLLMSERFVADPQHVKKAQAQFAAAVGTPDEAAAEVLYRRATVSPRRRLLQRFSANLDGVRFLVDMRAELQPQLKSDKRLLALDVEMEYMFSTWFDVGFLDLRRITWDSPASLVEKLIKYEAVHDIRSWADVKNRLDSDRRCYGFFHPRLPEEPLIFVEVALMNEIADSITPLLDESAAPADLGSATTAIFYSISNTQTGLKGVSFGDSLIKRVVETLKQEFPRLKTFATLSPIPGLRAWLSKNAPADMLKVWEQVNELDEESEGRRALMGWAARYLGDELHDGKPLDPVARFHLGNGARVERLNWAADPSAKGQKQSYGLMVNYLYDLKRLDKHRASLAQGKIPIAAAIKDHYL
ncbi:malonyl-CoA decarboxylase domain-containing protein [Hydrogenophaga laconesensis]|uniref:Malonyl-CoA decarboxylase n=1 Tax=Hydrogenophaga laconesensis TaxID=1805971 RepID=A0ABU1VHU6_9BURK|nr:malonyl-CoA decarboxylase family protein [Hydrogenophaga laconesensis]MDR7097045.1 malonyl-CoA decarboxylase [Hydrogenophaga laconesensis]